MSWIYKAFLILILNVNSVSAGSLILLVDISSSIEEHEMHLQFDSYAKLMYEMPALRNVYIEVVLFSDGAELISVGSNEDAARAFINYPILEHSYRGITCLTEALRFTLNRIKDMPTPVIIDISGDGQANCRSDDYIESALDEIAATGTRINTLYINTEDDPMQAEANLRFYQQLPRNGGFNLVIEDFYDFELALFEKLTLELATMYK